MLMYQEKLKEWKLKDGTLSLDDKGVIITEALAQDMYHSAYVVGESLQYEGQKYTVRGVVSDEKKFFPLRC